MWILLQWLVLKIFGIWLLVIILLCLYFLISEVEHLFIDLQAIIISFSLSLVYSCPLPVFFYWCVPHFLINFTRGLHVLGILTLCYNTLSCIVLYRLIVLKVDVLYYIAIIIISWCSISNCSSLVCRIPSSHLLYSFFL